MSNNITSGLSNLEEQQSLNILDKLQILSGKNHRQENRKERNCNRRRKRKSNS